MKVVAIVGKPGRASVGQLAQELNRTLKARGIEVLLDPAVAKEAGLPATSPAEIGSRAELVVVLGGDGTLLQAAAMVSGHEIPVLGVNLGSLGFMTEIALAELTPMLDRVLAGEYKAEPRSKLRVRLVRNSQTVLDAEILNDAVIKVGAVARIADIEASIDGVPLTTYKADGIIVSTPTGSTAYGLSSGGPIVHPTLQAIVISAICPHTLAQRPVVVPGTAKLVFEIKPSSAEVFLTIDGQAGSPVNGGDQVLVEAAKTRLLLIRSPYRDFFSILRAKLRWGER